MKGMQDGCDDPASITWNEFVGYYNVRRPPLSFSAGADASVCAQNISCSIERDDYFGGYTMSTAGPSAAAVLTR